MTLTRRGGDLQQAVGCERAPGYPPLIAVNSDDTLGVRHDEGADRAMITTAPEAYMAIVVLTRLYLLTLEHVAGRDVEPAGNRLHQLIAGDREAIHLAAAG